MYHNPQLINGNFAGDNFFKWCFYCYYFTSSEQTLNSQENSGGFWVGDVFQPWPPNEKLFLPTRSTWVYSPRGITHDALGGNKHGRVSSHWFYLLSTQNLHFAHSLYLFWPNFCQPQATFQRLVSCLCFCLWTLLTLLPTCTSVNVLFTLVHTSTLAISK